MDTDSELAPPPAPPTARLPRPLAPPAGPLPHVQATTGVPGALRAFNRFSVGGEPPPVAEAPAIPALSPAAPAPATPSATLAPAGPPRPLLRRPATPPPPSAAPHRVPAPERPAQPPLRPPAMPPPSSAVPARVAAPPPLAPERPSSAPIPAPPARATGPAPAAAPAEPPASDPTTPPVTVAEPPAPPVSERAAPPVSEASAPPAPAPTARVAPEVQAPPAPDTVAPSVSEPAASPVTAAAAPPPTAVAPTVAEPAASSVPAPTAPAPEAVTPPAPATVAPPVSEPPGPTPTPATTGVRAWLVVIARPRTWRDAVPALIGAVVIAAAVAGIAALPGRGVGSTTLPAADSVAAVVASARDRAAAGDPAGAARELLARASTASPDERGILREQAARILVDAATAQAGAGHPSESLDLDRAAAGLSDTPTGAIARAGLPDAILAAARGLIQSGDASTAAQSLLNELVAGYPSTPAAVEAGALLRDPTPVRGALTVGGRPSAATTVYLFATTGGSDPQPSLATPVAAATTGPDGRFDLGTVAPGTYLFAWRTPGGALRRAAGADALAVVTPARVNVLDEIFAS